MTVKLDANEFLSKHAEQSIKTISLETKLCKSKTIHTQHILLALLREDDSTTSRILKKFGINYDVVFELVSADELL